MRLSCRPRLRQISQQLVSDLGVPLGLRSRDDVIKPLGGDAVALPPSARDDGGNADRGGEIGAPRPEFDD